MTKGFLDLQSWKEIAAQVLSLARKNGASDAEMACSVSQGFNVSARLGEVETIEYHRDKGIDITVFFGTQAGSSSTSEIYKQSIENAVAAACIIAKATGRDPCHGLAEAKLMAHNYPDLDLYYPWPIEVDQAITLAKNCEKAGREWDVRITNSEGATVSTHENFYLYANTRDFIGHYFSTRHAINCALLSEAQDSRTKVREYEFTAAHDPAELLSPEIIGEKAAQKTVARLNARKLSTRQTPVIFASQIARGLLGHFASAISGGNLYRNASFLCNCLDKPVFPDFVHIEENPHIPKASGSIPFDGEGVLTRSQVFVEKGILKRYSLDSYSARKLHLQTTGNAGGMHNLIIKPTIPGQLEDLLKLMDTGLLVTEVMGQGVNIVTGNYSRGAAGFWVEKGEIQYPVHEITIAGSLPDMFLHLIAAGSDIDKRRHLWSGSLLFENMTVAGE